MPTPTPTPVLWPTPTLIPLVQVTPGFTLGQGQFMLAENLVQGYQRANQFGALDLLFVAIILFLVIGGIWSIMRHVQRI